MRLLRIILSPGRIIFVATMVVACYLGFSASTNLLHSYHLANDEAQLQVQVDRLRQKQDELQQIRDYLRTDEYVEFMARRVFGFVKPGEKLVDVDAPAPPPPSHDPSPSTAWWERLFGR